MINAGLIGSLVNLLQNTEFDVKKEAAWAVSNATSGGTHEQIKYVVSVDSFGIVELCFFFGGGGEVGSSGRSF